MLAYADNIDFSICEEWQVVCVGEETFYLKDNSWQSGESME